MSDLVYGQPSDEYEVFNLPFAETRVRTRHRSGYKLHVTVSTQHHAELAAVILPTLRVLHTHHKVVMAGFYEGFNAGRQQGKFITVYAGPEQPARRIVDTIDPVLMRLKQGGVQPGPRPMNRQLNHSVPEDFVGRSQMITWLWLDDLMHG